MLKQFSIGYRHCQVRKIAAVKVLSYNTRHERCLVLNDVFLSPDIASLLKGLYYKNMLKWI
jgi:hypothetical protein